MNKKFKTQFPLRCFLALALSCITVSLKAEPVSLDLLLEPIRATNVVPAMAAAVIFEGKVVGLGAVGVRRAGFPERVELNDKWHIGSCTKSMTAALAGMMVDEGQWRWDMNVGEMLPSLTNEIRPEWQSATLEQFLAHYSGAGGEGWFEPGLFNHVTEKPTEQRGLFVRQILVEHTPVTVPGTSPKYDNANYVVVGYALEQHLKKPWEDILRERLFDPLGMKSAGFGPPAKGKSIRQPWGHVIDDTGNVVAIPPDALAGTNWVSAGGKHIFADNPAALGPAGTVHCAIGDLAKYVEWQLHGARGEASLLSKECFKKLQTRYGTQGEFAGGWMVSYRDWANGETLSHAGSNRTFMTVIWMAPKRNFAVIVCSNLGGSRAEKGVDEAAGAMIKKFLSK